MLLGSIMLVMALALAGQLQQYMDDPDNSLEARREIFMYFGTFNRSFLTCFEITLANWVPVCRALVDEVHPSWTIVFLIYRACVGFAVVKVVSAVFMHETFKCAAADDDLAIRQKARAGAKLLRKLENFFRRMDVDGNGEMCFDEFKVALEDPNMKSWLSTMQIEIHDPQLVWEAAGHKARTTSCRDMARYMARIKREAKHVDLEIVAAMVRQHGHLLEEVNKELKAVRTTSRGMTSPRASAKSPQMPSPSVTSPQVVSPQVASRLAQAMPAEQRLVGREANALAKVLHLSHASEETTSELEAPRSERQVTPLEAPRSERQVTPEWVSRRSL